MGYQWYHKDVAGNDQLIPNAISASLTIGLISGIEEGEYRVQVCDVACSGAVSYSVFSAPALLPIVDETYSANGAFDCTRQIPTPSPTPEPGDIGGPGNPGDECDERDPGGSVISKTVDPCNK
jgi:hypothetical protein